MREELVRVCVGMRGDACHVVAKILKCSKLYFQRVTNCHDKNCQVHMRDIGRRIS